MNNALIMEFNREIVETNSLLSKRLINKYDIETTFDLVVDKLDTYMRLQYKYLNILPPKVTANFQIKYESFMRKVNDSVGNHVEKKLDAEQDLKEFYDELALVLYRMTEYELIYYNDVLINHYSESSVSEN